jgi:hypothetical protein
MQKAICEPSLFRRKRLDGPAEVNNALTHAMSMPSFTSSRVCGVCTQVTSRYTCPRCNIAYCSTQCYSKHGGECTELFFSVQVAGEKTLQGVDDDLRRKTLAALLVDRAKGIGPEVEGDEGEKDTNDDDCGGMNAIPVEARETLRVLALALEAAEARAADDAAAGRDNTRSYAAVEAALETLDRALPPGARRAFLRAAASGSALNEAGNAVENPWWLDRNHNCSSNSSSIIVQNDEDNEDAEEDADGVAVSSSSVPNVETRTITTHTILPPLRRPPFPSPNVSTDAFFASPEGAARVNTLAPNAVEILFAYAHVARLFGWRALTESSICGDAALALVSISSVLGADERHANVRAACAAAAQAARAPSLRRDAGTMPLAALAVALIRDDVAGGLLTGSPRATAAARAFGHIAAICTAAAARLASGDTHKCVFLKAAHKATFFVAWSCCAATRVMLHSLQNDVLVYADEAAEVALGAVAGTGGGTDHQVTRPPRLLAKLYRGGLSPTQLLAGELLGRRK